MTTDHRTATAAVAHEPRSGAIVVGIDGSDTSHTALLWAASEARVLDAPLTVCHVAAAPAFPDDRPVGVDFGDIALRQAHVIATQSLPAERVVTVRRHGDRVRALAELSYGAQLLVIGTHGSMAYGGHLFASFSLRMITHAHCPVVAIPRLAGRVGPFSGHVVVGMDGSEAARRALEFGFAYADRHSLPLALVHVTDEPPGGHWTDDTVLEAQFAAEPHAEALLATEAEQWAASYPGVQVKRAVYAGHVVPGLLRAASGARLLAVGDRGQGLADTTVLGTVVQHMVGSVACPVAVLSRPPGNQDEPRRPA